MGRGKQHIYLIFTPWEEGNNTIFNTHTMGRGKQHIYLIFTPWEEGNNTYI